MFTKTIIWPAEHQVIDLTLYLIISCVKLTHRLIFFESKRVISNSPASKPKVPGQKKTLDLLYFVTARLENCQACLYYHLVPILYSWKPEIFSHNRLKFCWWTNNRVWHLAGKYVGLFYSISLY